MWMLKLMVMKQAHFLITEVINVFNVVFIMLHITVFCQCSATTVCVCVCHTHILPHVGANMGLKNSRMCLVVALKGLVQHFGEYTSCAYLSSDEKSNIVNIMWWFISFKSASCLLIPDCNILLVVFSPGFWRQHDSAVYACRHDFRMYFILAK